MDRNYIEQHLLVDRYIQGKLGESALDAFEERLIWDEELVDEVELAERLRIGLKDAAAAKADIIEKPGFDLVAAVSGLFAVPQFAAAASFLLAVALTVSIMTVSFVESDGGFEAPELQTDIVPLFATRSDDVMSIKVDPGAWTVLLVDVMGDYPAYRVTVRRGDVMGDYPAYRVTVRRGDPDSSPVWMQDGLLPTYPESLAIGMPGSKLTTGRYVLTIEGAVVADAGAILYERIQDIPFATTPAD